jgi:iron complex transport system substrate-binding protein
MKFAPSEDAMQKIFFTLCFVVLFSFTSLAQDSNLQECVTEYDASTDYFPEKASVDYATGFTVEYFNNYKVVNILNPFPGATEENVFRYVLVQCGTPAPTNLDNALVIEVPTNRVIAMSTTFLPHLVVLNELDSLVGVDSLLYITTPEVLEISTDLIEVGFGSSVNIEVALAAEPTLVFANASGSAEFDAYPVLLEADIPVAISGDYVEQDPLGRAEWLKFTALFFNQEKLAQDLFSDIATQYEDLLALTANIPAEERPTVLWGSYSSFGEAWFIPGSNTYVAQLLTDAAINYSLSDSDGVKDFDGSVPLDFEVVYVDALEADLWIPDSFGVFTLADLLAQDERYADLPAFQNGQVFTNGAQVNENGGNAYFESGVINPHLILSDLIKITHPDLLPDYELTYFVQLN